MKMLFGTFALALALGLSNALAETAPPSSAPAALETQGAPLQQTPSISTLPSGSDDVDSDFPTAQLSTIAQTPVRDVASRTRSAKDSALYRSISPSVVLIATKVGIGSGTLVSSVGDIVTSYHVVRGYSDVAVVFKPTVEGMQPSRDDIKRGHVAKYDAVADLALVKVDDVPAGRAPVRLGDSGEINIGADVHAIGHPNGETWSFTNGIISQYRAEYTWKSKNEGVKYKADVIQTQTPINPGNSGGPLISDSGTLIGVNAFKSEGEGLNFAVSIDDVKQFLSRSGNVAAQTSKPSTAKASCQMKEIARFRSKDNAAAVITYDFNCSGKSNAEYVVPDEPSAPIMLKMDRNGDGMIDVIYYDFNRRGKWDMSYWDETFSGHWTLVGFHRDGSLKPTSFESYEAFKQRMAQR